MPFAAGLELGARQLSSAEAAALRPFAALLDLVPCNDSPALLAADGRRPLTYRRLRAAAARFPAGGLRLGRGSRLAAVSPHAWPAAAWAASKRPVLKARARPGAGAAERP